MFGRHLGPVAAVLVVLLSQASMAAESDFLGDWMVELVDGQRTLVGLLEIERQDGDLVAFLEGGPARIVVDGDGITVWADSRDVRGFVFDRKLVGKLEAGRMSGRTVLSSFRL